jgi:phage terminase small subunit
MTPDQKFLFDQLTPLQQRVATNVLSGMSQRAAYRLAGGTAQGDDGADNGAYVILSNSQVKAFLDAMKEEAVSEAIMTRKEAMEKLTLLARTDLKDLVDFDSYELGVDEKSGNPIIQAAWKVKPSAMQDPKQMAAISELSAGREGIKIKTHSQIEAMKQLGKMMGWEAPQKLEHTGKDGGPMRIAKEMTDDDLEAIARGAGVKPPENE